ncbi:MAG: HDOD domain-containing protein [Treponema sp.]|nr:HDOD domain-containing protein [Treponema sp.]
MDDQDFSLLQADREKIKQAVKLHTPIEITSYTLPKNMEVYIQEVLALFLKECHQEHMTEYIKFCLSELLTNSKKANTKRVYFNEKGLDINNEEDYNEGMMFFKDETLLNIDHYLEEQKKAGLYIKLVLRITDDSILIEIKNNSVLSIFEKQRIEEKLVIAQQYDGDGIEDVFTNILDQTEGAGLGIVITIRMLQKIGLSTENFKIITDNKETITSIELPLNQNILEHFKAITKEFASIQNKMPVIKDNLDLLVQKLNAPDALPEDTIEIFAKDETLSLLLIRNALVAKDDCYSISEAVKLLGLDGMRSVFCGSKTNELIRYIDVKDDKENLWGRSSKIAFYAYNLAKNYPCNDFSPEEIFTFALFLDIQRLLIEVATTDTLNHMEAFSKAQDEADLLDEEILDLDEVEVESVDVESSDNAGYSDINALENNQKDDSVEVSLDEFIDSSNTFDATDSNEHIDSDDSLARAGTYSKTALEIFYTNACHCICGSEIAKAWGLSDKIADIIKYHNAIHKVSDELKPAVEYLYFADMIQLYMDKKLEFYQLESSVLERFKIESEFALDYLIKQLQSVTI